MMRIELTTRLRIPGLHRWPEAPEPVTYLRMRHRHLFQIECSREVTDDNREIEFILFQNEVRRFIADCYIREADGSYDFDTLSCEQLAKLLIGALNLTRCTVSEDGENGATVFA